MTAFLGYAFYAVSADNQDPGADTWDGRKAQLGVVNPPVRSKLQEVISLRGKWEFAADPKAVGRDAGWMRPGTVWPGQREMEVPGCWEAQGVGEPGTSRIWGITHDANPYPLRHIYMGAAWYRRSVAVPEAWAGKRVWLKIGGVRAQGWFWVNGHPVAQVENFCAVNKYDITDLVTPGKAVAIVAMVRNDLPSRMGQVSSLHRWGGLYRDVELESTPSTRIDNCWVRGDFDQKGAEVHVTVAVTADAGKLKNPVLRVKIQSAVGSSTLEGERSREPSGAARTEPVTQTGNLPVVFADGQQTAEVVCRLPLVPFRPWSPESPALYIAEVTLCDGEMPVHGWSERFGVRKLEVRGDRFFLNNEPFLIRGYGDDYIYPLTLCSPASREAHRKHLEVARRSGFNYVRHHTHTEIPEFYDAADELGIFVQPELPYYGHAATDQFSFDPKRELSELITHYRRYVSLATYSMGNEGSLGTPLDNELYQMVKRMDPARLAIHQDGGRGNTKDNSDFRPGPIQLWKPGSFVCDAPYVAHEYLNLGLKSDPRLDPRFSGPYAPANDLRTYEAALKRVGLSRAWGDACMDAGHALQRYYQKQGLETARLDPTCDGYSFWTIVDVLCKQRGETKVYAGQGLYNAFWEQKSGGAAPEDFRTFNGPTALLMRPDWKIAAAGDTVDVALSVSHFGDRPFSDATLDWTLREGRNVLASGSLAHLDVAIGDVRELGVAKVTIPELTHAVHAVLEAKLKGSDVNNQWDFWLFPKRIPKDGKGLAASDDLYPLLSARYPGIARAGTPEGDAADVLVTTTGDSAALTAGRRVVLLELDDAKANVSFAWWWIGDQAGTAMARHPVFGDFPHSGFLSPLWFGIVKHADLLLPADAYRGAEPLMVGEGILGYYVYLSQARVGKGRLLRASGLDLVRANPPESVYLLDKILDYARSDAFAPQAALDLTGISARWKQRQALIADCGRLNGWRHTSKAAARWDFAGQGKASMLGMQPDKNELAWETPAGLQEGQGDKVTFNWLHGVAFSCWSTAVDHRQRMTLHFNGKPLLKFSLDVTDREWTVSEGGAALRYRGIAFSKIESSGLMSLTVPRALINRGQPNSLKLVGEIGEDGTGWNGIIEKNSIK